MLGMSGDHLLGCWWYFMCVLHCVDKKGVGGLSRAKRRKESAECAHERRCVLSNRARAHVWSPCPEVLQISSAQEDSTVCLSWLGLIPCPPPIFSPWLLASGLSTSLRMAHSDTFPADVMSCMCPTGWPSSLSHWLHWMSMLNPRHGQPLSPH